MKNTLKIYLFELKSIIKSRLFPCFLAVVAAAAAVPFLFASEPAKTVPEEADLSLLSELAEKAEADLEELKNAALEPGAPESIYSDIFNMNKKRLFYSAALAEKVPIFSYPYLAEALSVLTSNEAGLPDAEDKETVIKENERLLDIIRRRDFAAFIEWSNEAIDKEDIPEEEKAKKKAENALYLIAAPDGRELSFSENCAVSEILLIDESLISGKDLYFDLRDGHEISEEEKSALYHEREVLVYRLKNSVPPPQYDGDVSGFSLKVSFFFAFSVGVVIISESFGNFFRNPEIAVNLPIKRYTFAFAKAAAGISVSVFFFLASVIETAVLSTIITPWAQNPFVFFTDEVSSVPFFISLLVKGVALMTNGAVFSSAAFLILAATKNTSIFVFFGTGSYISASLFSFFSVFSQSRAFSDLRKLSIYDRIFSYSPRYFSAIPVFVPWMAEILFAALLFASAVIIIGKRKKY